MSEIFYVYFLIDSRSDSIFYIGKGKNLRAESHFKEFEKYVEMIEQKIPTSKGNFANHNKLQKMLEIKKAGFEVKLEYVSEYLSEKAAYILEEILVERFGRKILKTGNLENIEPGGKWKYPKLVLFDEEKTKIEEIEINFPYLKKVIDKYPKISISSEIEENVKNYMRNNNKN
jgi:hypothetical protein